MLDAIAEMDSDVLSIETSRSKVEVARITRAERELGEARR